MTNQYWSRSVNMEQETATPPQGMQHQENPFDALPPTSSTPASSPSFTQPVPDSGFGSPAVSPSLTPASGVPSFTPSPDVPASSASGGTAAASAEGPLTGKRLLERIVQLVAAKNGSDIHLMEGDRPRVRLH